MVLKKERVLLPTCLLLLMLLAGISGCGTNSSSSSTGGSVEDRPDRLQIEEKTVVSPTKSIVTLTNSALLEQFYATIFDLEPAPENQACTAEMGPSYVLTFFQGGKTLTVVSAERYGCRPVTIAGDDVKRQSTDAFWKQLDQAILKASPAFKPTNLSILHTPKLSRPSETAQIDSEETAQRLYNALLELPLVSLEKNCVGESLVAEPRYHYQLAFHTNGQKVTSAIDHKCNTISLSSDLHTTGGVYEMSEQFRTLLNQTLAGAKFAPAVPDRLTLSLNQGNGTSSYTEAIDPSLRQQLYTKAFQLPLGKAGADCPSDTDKKEGKGKWYTYTFTQEDLPVLELEAFEGEKCHSASLINEGTGAQLLQTDDAFWNLVHSTTNNA